MIQQYQRRLYRLFGFQKHRKNKNNSECDFSGRNTFSDKWILLYLPIQQQQVNVPVQLRIKSLEVSTTPMETMAGFREHLLYSNQLLFVSSEMRWVNLIYIFISKLFRNYGLKYQRVLLILHKHEVLSTYISIIHWILTSYRGNHYCSWYVWKMRQSPICLIARVECVRHTWHLYYLSWYIGWKNAIKNIKTYDII